MNVINETKSTDWEHKTNELMKWSLDRAIEASTVPTQFLTMKSRAHIHEVNLTELLCFPLNRNWDKKVKYQIEVINSPENIPAAIETFDRRRKSIFGEDAAVHRSSGWTIFTRILCFFNLNDESLIRHNWDHDECQSGWKWKRERSRERR